MTRPIRLALIGAGAIGRHHLIVAAKNADFEIVGIADPVPAALERQRAAGRPVFTDLRALLDEANPDAAIIATPNAHHVPMTLACIERKVAVLVEKPVSDSLETAATLRDTVARSGVPVLVGHHRRHNPLLRHAAAHIASGAIGRVIAAVGLWLRRKHDGYFADRWKLEAPSGGGVLLINTIHDFDCLRMLCGDIESIQAVTSSATRGFAVEDTAAIAVRFASGALGTITVSDATASPWSWEMTAQEDPRFATQPENCYLVCGSAGSLSVPTLETWTNAPDAGRESPFTRRRLHYVPADSMTEQLAHFAQVVRREAEPIVSVGDAAQSLAATLAVRLSAQGGREIRLADILR
jgi:predicted dehydrogenase